MVSITAENRDKFTMDIIEIPDYKSYYFLRPVWRKERFGCNHALAILRAGLLFREDSVRVELAILRGAFLRPNLLERYSAPEAFSGALGAAACLVITRCARPLSLRSALVGLSFAALAALLPLAWRHKTTPALSQVLQVMTAHTRRWRRLPLPPERGAKLCVALGAASQALVRACPWLHEVPQEWEWEQGPDVSDALALRDTKKLHHLYLVLQSSFLRRVAMAHALPNVLPSDLMADMPRRIVWVHNQLLPAVQSCLATFLAPITPPLLSPQHRTIMPSGNEVVWKFSQLHNSISELSVFLEHNTRLCSDIDFKMEGFRLNQQDLKLKDYQKDLDKLKEGIVKAVTTIEAITEEVNSLLLPEDKRRKKDDGRAELTKELVEKKEEAVVRVVSEETEMEIEDQCFYYEKKDEGETIVLGDIPGGPGAREMDAAKTLLEELRQRLVQREDTMRARETAALVKTMPELKDNMPEFPRQMPEKEDYLPVEENSMLEKQDNLPEKEDKMPEFPRQILEKGHKMPVFPRQILEKNDKMPEFPEQILEKGEKMPEFPGQILEKGDKMSDFPRQILEKGYKMPAKEENISGKGDNPPEFSRQMLEKEARCEEENRKLKAEVVQEKETTATKSIFGNDSNSAENLAENTSENCVKEDTKQAKTKEAVEEILNVGELVEDKLSKGYLKKEEISGDTTGEEIQESNDKIKESQNLINTEKSKHLEFMTEQFFEHSGSDTEDSSEGSGLLKDIRKGRVSRKKNHPPSRNGSLRLKKAATNLSDGTNQKDELGNGSVRGHERVVLPDEDGRRKGYSRRGYQGMHRPEDSDDSWQPSQPSLGAGLAMASLLAGGLKGALGDEDTFTGEGEQEPDSGNEE